MITHQPSSSPFSWQTETFWSPVPDAHAYPSLGTNDVHVWCAKVDDAAREYAHFYTLLAVDEAERAQRFYFEKDRRCYVTARGILRTLLGHYTQTLPEEIQFQYSEKGKPSIDPALNNNKETKNASLEFNISHSANMILAAFAYNRIIGVDVEYMRPSVDCDGIVTSFFSPKEVATYRSLPDDIRRLAFFECWTRKEACLKAWGSGLAYPLAKFDVTLAPNERPELLYVEDEPNEPGRWSMHRLACEDEYAGTVLIEKDDWSLNCWEWGGLKR